MKEELTRRELICVKYSLFRTLEDAEGWSEESIEDLINLKHKVERMIESTKPLAELKKENEKRAGKTQTDVLREMFAQARGTKK